MPKLDRDGVKIHYEVHGSGPAVLLSHGYSATCRMWDGQIAVAGGTVGHTDSRCRSPKACHTFPPFRLSSDVSIERLL